MNITIIGAGLTGATAARLLVEGGHSVRVIESRDVVGGNCATDTIDGVVRHLYGPHLFHTSNEWVWAWMQRWGQWYHYHYRPRAKVDGRVYPFPINRLTIEMVHGSMRLWLDAVEKFQEMEPTNMAEALIKRMGHRLYNMFYRGYTLKQWGKPCEDLPPELAYRVPVRTTYNDNYFDDPYQALPTRGYSEIIGAMLDHPQIKVELRTNWLGVANEPTVYTGCLGQYFNVHLPYRSNFFAHYKVAETQGAAVINHPDVEVDHVRTIDHAQFAPKPLDVHWITVERPYVWNPLGSLVPCYPLWNRTTYNELKRKASGLTNFWFCGRLGRYTYMNMDQAVLDAKHTVEKLLCS